ncbi:MAG TPA: hypothetical protein DCP31_27745, partial [Cyanobacteria bacterium UBA8543]|nr:hypothetical protein [Cyanobacteria bacterium UBA8543]
SFQGKQVDRLIGEQVFSTFQPFNLQPLHRFCKQLKVTQPSMALLKRLPKLKKIYHITCWGGS